MGFYLQGKYESLEKNDNKIIKNDYEKACGLFLKDNKYY